MSAFITSTGPGSFLLNSQRNTLSKCNNNSNNNNATTNTNTTTTTSMKATIPDPSGPATRKYLQYIGTDRLNKAPMITINSFKNEDYNSIIVNSCEFAADIAAGNQIKLGVQSSCIDEDEAPAESKYNSCYDVNTIHEAPEISIYNHGDCHVPPTVVISQNQAPLRVEKAQQILDQCAGSSVNPPDRQLYKPFDDERLNKAPCLKITQPSKSDYQDKGRVQIESVNMPLDLYSADLILSTYRC